eukprot:CAMPEP_0202920506 /NCGR_PEP_ID=MMETSP1392-20130828/76893_1 /ASSEMBLY_ACC=CAM_ASM_000868 /TAXON_ID=225041 /ORGANISM="Chlamydomonas chlamydogama, Strain SAG 11-48b" /LENGTH=632 /DNA_ID=CAMNT_0049614003 /DNA_START=124 /DNA_END=2022 /DNA_ORIENTATION=+
MAGHTDYLDAYMQELNMPSVTFGPRGTLQSAGLEANLAYGDSILGATYARTALPTNVASLQELLIKGVDNTGLALQSRQQFALASLGPQSSRAAAATQPVALQQLLNARSFNAGVTGHQRPHSSGSSGSQQWGEIPSLESLAWSGKQGGPAGRPASGPVIGGANVLQGNVTTHNLSGPLSGPATYSVLATVKQEINSAPATIVNAAYDASFIALSHRQGNDAESPSGGSHSKKTAPSSSHGLLSPSGQQSLTLQEKNRCAQRRFRQRQKERMTQLEKRADHLQAALDKVSSDYTELRSMNAILEKVLHLRDEHISTLQEAAKVFNAGGAAAEGIEAVAATLGPVMMDASAPASEAHPESSTNSQHSGSHGQGGPGNNHYLLTPANLKAMVFADVADFWRSHVKELSKAVLPLEDPATASMDRDAAVRSIQQQMAMLLEGAMKIGQVNPMNIKRLYCTNLETMQTITSREISMDYWRKVVARLHLSQVQLLDIGRARERYMGKITAILKERQEIVSSLPMMMPASIQFTDLTSSCLAIHEQHELLASNLKREHLCNMEFGCLVTKEVLDLTQLALAQVHSYPLVFDPVAASEVVVAELGLMGGGTTPGSAAAAPPPAVPSSPSGHRSPTSSME